MNFYQLLYFTTIVECDFNLTLAADKIHISQPALSKFIIRFEDEHGVALFYRRKGRLVGLTKAGEIIYAGALKMQVDYSRIMESIDEMSEYYGGTVRIGIPPLILSTLFAKLIPQLINLNPNVKFEVFEKGDRSVQSDLENQQLDFGVILYPNTVNAKLFNEVVLFRDHLSAFMNHNHALVSDEQSVTWHDLDDVDFVLANSDFKIRDQILEKLVQYKASPNIRYETASSTFAIETLKHSDFVTILPNPLKNIVNLDNITLMNIDDPIDWVVSLVYPKKESYSRLELYIIQTFTDFFIHGKSISSICAFND